MRTKTLVTALGAAALIAGCSSNPSKAPETKAPDTSPSAPTSSQVQHGALAGCLHDHGVPDSAGPAVLGPPAGVDQATWDSAMKACSTLAPGPGPVS